MKLVQEFQTHSEAETIKVGFQIANSLPPDSVVSLLGDLGAGKTTISKGIVRGRLGTSRDEVSSPTFTLIHEYGEPVAVHHVDLYRLNAEEEAGRLGLDEIFSRPGLVLVEWADRFPQLLPRERYEIQIVALDECTRIIRVFYLEGG